METLEDMQKRIEELEQQNEKLEFISRIKQEHIEILAEKRDELAAHCNTLTDEINGLDVITIDYEEGGKLFCQVPKERFEKVIDLSYQTKKQSLANIKADAIEAWIKSGVDLVTYVKQLREQGNA